MPRKPPHPCPKCKRPAPAIGTLTARGVGATVHQCQHCGGVARIMGADFPVLYTFGIDENGRVFDVEDPAADSVD